MLSSSYFDFDDFARGRRDDRMPRHLLPELAERLGTSVEQPTPDLDDGGLLDRLGALLYGRAGHWTLARRMLPELRDGDGVFAAGCDSGLPLALLCGLRRRRVSFAVAFADTGRLRSRVAGHLVRLLGVRMLAIVTTGHQAELALGSFGRGLAGVHAIEGQTDCTFFRPLDHPGATPAAGADRPVVASCGVEQRDYATLAEALAGSDVDVRICYASPNRSSRTAHTVPDPVPANAELRHYEFLELRELYRTADVVVVPLLENRYSAGLTTLFEAIGCGAPVVVTHSPGVIDGLIEEGLVVGVPPGDRSAMRSAVESVLADPRGAAERARAAREAVEQRYSATAYLERLVHLLIDFEQSAGTVPRLGDLPSTG